MTVTRRTPQESTNRRWRGIAAAPGIAMGPAFVYRVSRDEPHRRNLEYEQDIALEQDRLDEALIAVRQNLKQLKEDAGTSVRSAIGKIFDAQVMIVEDATIIADVKAMIKSERVGAESAFAKVLGAAEDTIRRSPDPYLREMASEIGSVSKRVINHLLGVDETIDRPLTSPVVVFAATITPADIVGLKRDCVLGIVTETGGQTSHTALLAKSLNIPAVVGVSLDVREVRPGTQVAVDGYDGSITLEPDEATVQFIERKKKRTRLAWPKRFNELRDLPAATRDNHRIDLMANIDLGGEAERVTGAGADGVGLFRTEYLYLVKGSYPTEQEQLAAYRQALEKLDGRRLVVRTFDLGSDKSLSEVTPENNPALGVRGIRLALRSPKTLETQLRALLRSSAYGPVWVMVPMIADVEELRQVRQRWDRVRNALQRQRVEFDSNTPLGIMVETPSAASLAPELAEQADFLSIGSNDLLQYTLAVDRGNPEVAHPDHKWHPALWRLVRQIVDAAQRHQCHVSLCGDLANEPKAVPFLIGMGLSGISCHPDSVPRLKELIRSLTYTELTQSVHELLSLSTMAELKAYATECHRRWKP